MTLRRIAIAVALVALVLPAAAPAQGLGDAAGRERAKREAAKKAGEAKVFTNEDLNEGRAGTPAAEAGAAAAAPAAPSSENAPPAADGGRQEPAPDREDRPDEETERRAQEQAYVDAVAGAESNVAGIEARIQELQARLNPMSPTFVYGDFNGVGTNKVAEEAEVKAELAQAQGELDSARQAVAAATRALQEFRQGRLAPSSGPR